MTGKYAKVQSSLPIVNAVRLLTATCLGLTLSLWSCEHALAETPWHPQWGILSSTQSASRWQIQQQRVVEVEVQVRTAGEAALLQSMGYSCGVGACQLELPDGEELLLMALALPVRVAARAIKLSGAPRLALADAYESGSNTNFYWIPEPTGSGCGDPRYYEILIDGAPYLTPVSKVTYSLRMEHSDVDDLVIYLSNFSHTQKVWEIDETGKDTDGGQDDDPEDDKDVELLYRTIYSTFTGDYVNQRWYLTLRDCSNNGETGSTDYFHIWVYYDCTGLVPDTPQLPSPPNNAINQAINVDLDWSDCAKATSYDVYFGTSSSPPKVATVTSSSYALPGLSYNTTYYWQVAAKNKCAQSPGPVWLFTTVRAPTATPQHTLTSTRTRTATPTGTTTRTATPTGTTTRTATPSATRTHAPTGTGVPSPTPSATLWATLTATRTHTPTRTGMPSPTPSATLWATLTPTRTARPTGSPGPPPSWRALYLPVVLRQF